MRRTCSGSGPRIARAPLWLAVMLVGGWLGCSPGEPDCQTLGDGVCDGPGGTGGQGGAGGQGGSTPEIKAPPASCQPLGVATTTGSTKALDEFETKFVAPRCGATQCHGNPTVFYPKNMNMPQMIRSTLVGKKASTLCKDDFYVNRADFTKSFILLKVKATGDTLECPTPGPKPGSGGSRMPNKDNTPGTVGERLSEAELECFEWWVESAASL